MEKINVINNAKNKIEVTVNEENGCFQIFIDSLENNKRRLSELKQYEHFFDEDGDEYVVCEHFSDGSTAIVCADVLKNEMSFGNTNNWKESDIRNFLNKEYLKELERKFGTKNILSHEVDLLSMDGFDDYGTSLDKVSIMTFDRFRKYSNGIGKTSGSHYLATPSQTPSRGDTSYVQIVDSYGYVDFGGCYWSRGVRPFFILKAYTKTIFNL